MTASGVGDGSPPRERVVWRAAVWGDFHTKLLTSIAAVAILLATVREVGTNWVEFWVLGAEVGSVLSQVCYAYFGGWIVNLLVIELPNERRRRASSPLRTLAKADWYIAATLSEALGKPDQDDAAWWTFRRLVQRLRAVQRQIEPVLPLYPLDVYEACISLDSALVAVEEILAEEGVPRDPVMIRFRALLFEDGSMAIRRYLGQAEPDLDAYPEDIYMLIG